MTVVPGIVLYDVVGQPVCSQGVFLTAARFEFLEKTSTYVELPFVFQKLDLDDLRAFFNYHDSFEEEVLHFWLMARIPAAFGYRLITGVDRDYGQDLVVPFLAIVTSDEKACFEAIPFLCVSDYNRTGLVFGRSSVDDATKQRIREAFEKTLFKSPHEIVEFEEWGYDDEAGLHKIYCKRGLLCRCDLEDWDDVRRGYDPHLIAFPNETFLCPDCGGTGLEEWFLTDDCNTCGGTGSISWCEP